MVLSVFFAFLTFQYNYENPSSAGHQKICLLHATKLSRIRQIN